jgi:hypothetical protein
MQRPEGPSGRHITEIPNHHRTARSVRHSGSIVWVHAFSKAGREARVRTEPLPTIRVRLAHLNQRAENLAVLNLLS